VNEAPASQTEKPTHRLKHQVRLRLVLVLLAVLGFGMMAYLLATIPPTRDSWYPKCTLHSSTGLHCPGCGTTRAAHAALNGDLLAALQFNAIAFVVLPLGLWWALHSALRWAYRWPQPTGRPTSTTWSYAVLVAILIFGVLRNIPAYPFTLLAPVELP
jgi:hypothetical protein